MHMNTEETKRAYKYKITAAIKDQNFDKAIKLISSYKEKFELSDLEQKHFQIIEFYSIKNIILLKHQITEEIMPLLEYEDGTFFPPSEENNETYLTSDQNPIIFNNAEKYLIAIAALQAGNIDLADDESYFLLYKKILILDRNIKDFKTITSNIYLQPDLSALFKNLARLSSKTYISPTLAKLEAKTLTPNEQQVINSACIEVKNEAFADRSYYPLYRAFFDGKFKDLNIIASKLTADKPKPTLVLKLLLSKMNPFSSQEKTQIQILPNKPTYNDDITLAYAGLAITKLVETKESLIYIFTKIIPIFNKSAFTLDEVTYTLLHFASTSVCTFAHPAFNKVMPYHKISIAAVSTSSYALKHIYYNLIKPALIKENSCLLNAFLDGSLGASSTMSFHEINNIDMIRLSGFSTGITSALSCYSNYFEEKNYLSSEILSKTTVAIELAAIYSLNLFGFDENAISNIHKIAALATLVATTHLAVKTSANLVIDYFYNGDLDQTS